MMIDNDVQINVQVGKGRQSNVWNLLERVPEI